MCILKSTRVRSSDAKKHLYSPACEYRQFFTQGLDTDAFCFAFMFNLLVFAYWRHRIRFKSFYFGKVFGDTNMLIGRAT